MSIGIRRETAREHLKALPPTTVSWLYYAIRAMLTNFQSAEKHTKFDCTGECVLCDLYKELLEIDAVLKIRKRYTEKGQS